MITIAIIWKLSAKEENNPGKSILGLLILARCDPNWNQGAISRGVSKPEKAESTRFVGTCEELEKEGSRLITKNLN